MDNLVSVSIITPSYNCENYISETIESVLLQSYQNWEMLIVDDCSTDASRSRILEFTEKDNRVKLIRLSENSGAAVARNKAIKIATGRYIAFLDSDDRWKPEKLEKQIAFMQKTGVALSYTAYDVVDEGGNKTTEFIPPGSLTYHDLLKTCSIGCLTAVYDAHQLGKVYMPLFRKRQDYGLWLKILKFTPEAQGLNESLAEYRLRGTSVSANKTDAAKYQWRVYREIEQLNIFQSAYFFVHYVVSGLRKYK